MSPSRSTHVRSVWVPAGAPAAGRAAVPVPVTVAAGLFFFFLLFPRLLCFCCKTGWTRLGGRGRGPRPTPPWRASHGLLPLPATAIGLDAKGVVAGPFLTFRPGSAGTPPAPPALPPSSFVFRVGPSTAPAPTTRWCGSDDRARGRRDSTHTQPRRPRRTGRADGGGGRARGRRARAARAARPSGAPPPLAAAAGVGTAAAGGRGRPAVPARACVSARRSARRRARREGPPRRGPRALRRRPLVPPSASTAVEVSHSSPGRACPTR